MLRGLLHYCKPFAGLCQRVQPIFLAKVWYYSPNFVHLKRAKSIIKMDANFLFEYLLQSQSIILTERLKNRQLEVHRLIFTYTYGACAAVPGITGGRNQRFLIYLISYLFTRQPRLSKPKQYLKISNNKHMNQFYTSYGHTFI